MCFSRAKLVVARLVVELVKKKRKIELKRNETKHSLEGLWFSLVCINNDEAFALFGWQKTSSYFSLFFHKSTLLFILVIIYHIKSILGFQFKILDFNSRFSNSNPTFFLSNSKHNQVYNNNNNNSSSISPIKHLPLLSMIDELQDLCPSNRLAS